MYGRDSRYRTTAPVVRVDPAGRRLTVDDIRVRLRRSGRFRHTLDGHDRLDHLGLRYYDSAHRWWLIADANPEFVSPLALLGADPFRRVRLYLDGRSAEAPSALLAALRDAYGVDDARFVHPVSDQDPDPGQHPSRGAIEVSFNQAVTDAVTVESVLRTAEMPPHTPPPPERPPTQVLGGRDGARIVVPPDTAGTATP
jgi:hypothetical protein